MCCDGKACCERELHLIGRPEDCTPEQIVKCHGSEKDHPCTSDVPKPEEK